MNTLLKLENVTLQAPKGNGHILESVSLRIFPGEFVALLGPSGAGKTSLFKLMNRLRSPSSGTIQFQGKPLTAVSVFDLRRQVMLVGQESRLLGMTVQESLHYPLVLKQLPEADRRAIVSEWVNRLRLPTEWLDRTELQLSGGQRQQVAIARALVTEPTLLLLDEPTSAQDLGAATRLLSAIKDNVREAALSVVMSNHQLELAEKFCDRVLYIEKGRILQDQVASEVDWQALRQRLLEADQQERDIWGDDDW